MKKLYIFIIIASVLLLVQGCISHQYTVDFSKEPPTLFYTTYGDTFDLYDGLLGFPADTTLWQKIDESRHESEDGPYWTMSWEGNRIGSLIHPAAPPEYKDLSQISFVNLNRFFYKESQFYIVFPTWEVERKFGDMEEFIPSFEEYIKITGLTEEDYDQYDKYKAVAMQKANVHRYLLQLQRILNIWQDKNDVIIDSLNKKDAYESLRLAIESHLQTKIHLDPREISLEWYEELRQPLIDASALVCNNEKDWCTVIADSLQHEWNLWMDMKDDAFDLRVIMPATWVSSNADSTSGDTLFWTFEGTELANDTYILEASGKSPVLWADILAVLIVVSGIVFILKKVK